MSNTLGSRKELSLNQKNTGAAIEKPLFVDQGCLEMNNRNHMKAKKMQNQFFLNSLCIYIY